MPQIEDILYTALSLGVTEEVFDRVSKLKAQHKHTELAKLYSLALDQAINQKLLIKLNNQNKNKTMEEYNTNISQITIMNDCIVMLNKDKSTHVIYYDQGSIQRKAMVHAMIELAQDIITISIEEDNQPHQQDPNQLQLDL